MMSDGTGWFPLITHHSSLITHHFRDPASTEAAKAAAAETSTTESAESAQPAEAGAERAARDAAQAAQAAAEKAAEQQLVVDLRGLVAVQPFRLRECDDDAARIGESPRGEQRHDDVAPLLVEAVVLARLDY